MSTGVKSELETFVRAILTDSKNELRNLRNYQGELAQWSWQHVLRVATTTAKVLGYGSAQVFYLDWNEVEPSATVASHGELYVIARPNLQPVFFVLVKGYDALVRAVQLTPTAALEKGLAEALGEVPKRTQRASAG